MKVTLLLTALATAAVAASWLGAAAEKPKPNAPVPAKKTPAESPDSAKTSARSSTISSDDEQATRKIVEQVEEAFNKHDAAAVAALFTKDAEIVNVHGHQTRGQDDIEKVFSDLFEASPESELKIEVDSIRPLTPSLMIEQGTSELSHVGDGPKEVSHYTVIYTREEDQWRMAYARDASAEDGNSEQIKQLSWLIGDWLDEDPSAVVTTTYRWAANQEAIEGEFHVDAPGYPEMNGKFRIGWDPQVRQLRSWIFDSEGGFATGYWSETEDGWMVKMSGVMHDGSVTSATSLLTRTSDDHLTYQSVDRTISGNGLPDGDEIAIVRRPPGPESVGQPETSSASE